VLTKTLPIGSLKAGPDDGLKDGEFLVYPSTFTRTPDAYGDVVAPGAFLDTLAAWKESGNTMPGLYGHRMDDPDYFVAEAIESGEDEHGWWVHGAFDLESPKAPQVYRLVKGRRLNQLSFAYEVEDSAEVELDDGTTANELRKLRVYEFSFVPVGANQDTEVVAVKAGAEALAFAAKIGRSISARNEGDIRSAVELLSGVLTSLDNDNEPKANSESVKEPPVEEPETVNTGHAEEPPTRHLQTVAASLSIMERKANVTP
jgi:uncharacterized protein